MVVELALALPLVLVMPGLLGLLVLGLLVLVMPALLPLALPALVLESTRARRPEQLTTRRRHEALGLVRGRRQQQQLPRHRGAVAAAA